MNKEQQAWHNQKWWQRNYRLILDTHESYSPERVRIVDPWIHKGASGVVELAEGTYLALRDVQDAHRNML